VIRTDRLVTFTSSSKASIDMSAEIAPPGFPNIVKKDHGDRNVKTRSSSAQKLQYSSTNALRTSGGMFWVSFPANLSSMPGLSDVRSGRQ
jgi:hypothetical protein